MRPFVFRSTLSTRSSGAHEARPSRSRTPPSKYGRPSIHTVCMKTGMQQLAATSLCGGPLVHTRVVPASTSYVEIATGTRASAMSFTGACLRPRGAPRAGDGSNG